MKKTINILVILMILTGVVFAKNTVIGSKNITYEKIEQTLLTGLESDNYGLSASSAYMLGEIKSEDSVNELARILRESDNEKIQLVAALSLYKIGTERSKFILKQNCRYEDNENVRNFCKHLCINSRNL